MPLSPNIFRYELFGEPELSTEEARPLFEILKEEIDRALLTMWQRKVESVDEEGLVRFKSAGFERPIQTAETLTFCVPLSMEVSSIVLDMLCEAYPGWELDDYDVSGKPFLALEMPLRTPQI